VVRDHGGVLSGLPLTALLSWAWIAFTIEADNAAEAAGSPRVGRLFRISLPMWANGLRFIGTEGISAGELRLQARAACNIGGLERWGWITVGDTAGGRRVGYGSHRGVSSGTVLRATRAGAYARRLWPEVVAGTEQRWRDRFGDTAVDVLQDALRRYPRQMPSALPEVHASDGFRTHVVDGPALGEDRWLAARLAHALTSLTLDQEEGAQASLPLGANFLRVIGGGQVPIRDLPALAGVSKEAVAMAAGYLERTRLADIGPQRSVTLTAGGRSALGDYRTRATARDDPALRAALEAVVSQREALAAGLVPPPGGWRGEKPYLAQTRRVLADPAAALPWHPMVLHRGGWPDGS
jgi:hypothetical protein